MRRLFRKVALATAVTSSILAASAQAEIRWDMPTPYVDSIHHTQNIREFVKDINTASDGELTINVHSGGSLFKHKEIPRAVRSGQVQIGEMLIGIMGNQNPIFKLDNLPFLATSFEQAEKLWKASRPEVEKALDKEGMKLLYSVPWPPQGIYSKDKISDIKDLNSTKMRAYSATTSRLAVLLGASPTTVQTVEVPQAFSTGIIDTMITSPSTGVSSQAWDYVNNYTDVQAWLPKNMVVVNKSAFRRLPKEIQNNIMEAAKNAEQRGWDKARKETVQKTAELTTNGISVALPTEHLMEQLNQVGATMTSEWLKESGKAGQQVISAYKQ